MKTTQRLLILGVLAILASARVGDATVRVITTLQDYASITREVGGERVDVEAIVAGNADPHFIKPKPSYALMLRDADLFVSTGLDLELWAPVLVNKAGNRKIVDGAQGYVAAATGIELLQKPASLDRSGGDIHIYGNPHIQTSPLSAKVIARNITTGLCKVDPEGCDAYSQGLIRFNDRISRRLYGSELVDLLGAETLDPLARKGRLISFLEEHGLKEQLGGWLAEGLPFRDRKIICYHKNWVYFATVFGLRVADYVEAKPGIPPTARHVADLIRKIKDDDIKVILAANYFEQKKPQMIADKTGIIPVIVATSVGGQEGIETYFDLIDSWVSGLNTAFRAADENSSGH
jgi:ABC-type Zn uptake system ZnuABC Zn-binding protein ZnuA